MGSRELIADILEEAMSQIGRAQEALEAGDVSLAKEAVGNVVELIGDAQGAV